MNPARVVPERFRSSAELDRLFAAFDAAAIDRKGWTHAEHIAIAIRHALLYSEPEATDRVRAGILRLNAAHGVEQTPTGGYHETLTRFYMWAVRRHVREAGIEREITELVNSAVRVLDRDLPLAYYSRDRLMSWDARTRWVEPDLRALDEATESSPAASTPA